MHYTDINEADITSKITKLKGELSQNIDIMAVVKYANDKNILELIKDGRITILGENKVQDAIKRWENREFANLRKKIKLHFIGHLQKNKIKYALNIFDSIDTIDDYELASEIDKYADKINKKIPVMIQLKINNRETQYGITPDNFEMLYNSILKMKKLSLRGIMVIGVLSDNPYEIKNGFKTAKKIYDKYFKEEFNKDGYKNYLSMGMTNDFKYAIEEGSNLIRIGSYFFN